MGMCYISKMLTTILTTGWGLRYPIIGAPMANIAHGRLARAITAGGRPCLAGIGGPGKREGGQRRRGLGRGAGAPPQIGSALHPLCLRPQPRVVPLPL